ncbi:MAG: hypothetical protein Kow00108_08010 [Calditrichia bacterium]
MIKKVGLICINLIILVGNMAMFSGIISQSSFAIYKVEEFYILVAGFYGFLLLQLFSKETIQFFYIFEHELTHIVTSLVLFKPVVGMNINIFKGGHVKIRGESAFIALSPYVLPLFALFIYLLHYLMIPAVQLVLTFFLGFFLGFYLLRLKMDIHSNQSDFEYVGFFLSIITIINVNLFFLSFMIYTYFFGVRELSGVLWFETKNLIRMLPNMIGNFL